MANLFIIGNGFDSAHKMKTSYNDFRKFLLEQYDIDNDDIENSDFNIPESVTLPDGEEYYDDCNTAKSIIKAIDVKEYEYKLKSDSKAELLSSERNTSGNTECARQTDNQVLWKCIEKAIGELDYELFLDDWGIYDKSDIRATYNKNEDCGIALSGGIRLIKKYFQKWVETIDVADIPLKDFQKLINYDEDMFLSFNYTNTLEKVYKVKDVCHIHGTQYDEIYFGHGNEHFDWEHYENRYYGAESYLCHLHEELKKDTEDAYKKHIDFFNRVRHCARENNLNIFSYGFSFSEVDLYYLEKMFSDIDTSNICFYINDYKLNTDKLKYYKKVLTDCGFKGQVSTFHVEVPLTYPQKGLFKNI